MPVHSNSLSNLRPPWAPGTSGNPAGRRKGSRNRRSVRAEKIGKTVLRYFPQLASKFENWTKINDFKHFYHNRVRVLRNDPEIADDAPRIVALEIEANVWAWQTPRRRKGYVCSRCGIRLYDNNFVALFDGGGECAWFHANCVLPELFDRKARAQGFTGRVF